MWLKLTPTAILAALVACSLSAEVCYNLLGCFSDEFPFNNTDGALPASPEDQAFITHLFTRSYPDGVNISYDDPSSLNSVFLSRKKVLFFTHGFGDNINATWMQESKDLILEKCDVNIVLVGWADGAALPDYAQAASNTRVVGSAIAVLIREMINAGSSARKIHAIGFSLGAQVVGAAGRVMGGTLGRVTGLDPAGPLFEYEDPAVRLDETDARFVDVTHTNGAPLDLLFSNGFGTLQPSGHVDFYVNGGEQQPGCLDSLLAILGSVLDSGKRDLTITFSDQDVCSHLRATELWVESITSTCPFTAYKCSSYSDFQQGQCNRCFFGRRCNVMGLYTSRRRAQGSLYITTNATQPYCLDCPP